MPFDDFDATLDRRTLLRRTGLSVAALAAPSILAACGEDESGSAGKIGSLEVKSDAVVYADYRSRATRILHEQAFADPFRSRTNCRVTYADADIAKIALFAEAGRAQWDAFDVDGWDVIRFGERGFLEELPPEVMPCDAVPKEFQKWTTGAYAISAVLGYRTDTSGPKPESWADFWDMSKFPGKRALPRAAVGFGRVLEAALLADGVPDDEVYPIDFDRAFAKLDEIREHTIFWESLGQSSQFLLQGSASMVFNTNNRMAILKDQDFPVEVVWNQAILTPWAATSVPKDPPNRDAALAFVSLMSQPERQAQFSELTFVGPAQSAALELLDEETLSKLPNSPEHEKVAFHLDNAAMAEQVDEYNERYTQWQAG
jgi:putative spermidine/putrescine transport system substrate-binding protein